jgi:uncharacterized protein (TIGR02996 family)
MNEREAFEQGIAKDPRDLTVRRIFADWLDEHDEPELADFHRQWTVEKYDEAWKWLREFAAFLSEEASSAYDTEDYEQTFTAEEFLDQMRQRVEKGEGGIYLGFDTPEDCWEGQPRMWECYELITGQKVTEHVKEEGFFSCAC